MGCASSNEKDKGTKVDTQRRRLSVGQADTTGVAADDQGSAEEQRGLMTELDQEELLKYASAGEGRKMSIGSATDAGKTSFANKATAAEGEKDDIQNLTTGMGFTCRKGLKPEAPNQDSWMVIKVDGFSIYGVFDGHGQKGHDVSNFVKDALPKLIFRDERFKGDKQQDMLKDVFKKTQALVSTADRMKKLSAQMSGTTVTVCIHDHTKTDDRPLGRLTLAHCADSTAVMGTLVSRGGKKEIQGTALTRDHKPNLKDERARIEKAGGRVVFDGYANHRVYAKNARYPGLNMSRCMGDLMGHNECGISCEPETTDIPLTADHAILLLCSDGVWEFMTPQESVQCVYDFGPKEAQKAADKLAREAWDRWIREEGGAVVDDITVVLIHLNCDAKG